MENFIETLIVRDKINEEIIEKIYLEIEKADKKHGSLPASSYIRLLILLEEVGEVCNAFLIDNTKESLEAELTQVAAMAIKLLRLLRGGKSLKNETDDIIRENDVFDAHSILVDASELDYRCKDSLDSYFSSQTKGVKQ